MKQCRRCLPRPSVHKGLYIDYVYSKAHPDTLFRDMMKTVKESGPSVHLTILAYHDDSVHEGAELPLVLLDLKKV